MGWRLAESLKKLREQINARWPNRDKSSDGAIGDTRHKATKSDHNPNAAGVVQAIDIDEDLAGDIRSIQFLVDAIIASRDPRVKYIIYEGRICSSYPAHGHAAWKWRPYSGTNPHRQHAHISVNDAPYHYDSRAEWAIGASKPSAVSGEQSASTSQKAVVEPVILEIPAPVGANANREVPATAPAQTAGAHAEPDKAPAVQQAENITNVQTGPSNVPPDFVPEDKEIPAPAKENSTKQTAKVTVLGFAVPIFLSGIVSAFKQAMADGYISAAQVGEVVLGFIQNNVKFVFVGLVLLIIGMMLKKLYKQITLWLSMWIAAKPDMHNVTVKPQ